MSYADNRHTHRHTHTNHGVGTFRGISLRVKVFLLPPPSLIRLHMRTYVDEQTNSLTSEKEGQAYVISAPMKTLQKNIKKKR